MNSAAHISPKQLEALARCIDAASRTDDGSGVELTIYGKGNRGYVQMERASTGQRWYIGPRGGVSSQPPVSPEEGGERCSTCKGDGAIQGLPGHPVPGMPVEPCPKCVSPEKGGDGE